MAQDWRGFDKQLALDGHSIAIALLTGTNLNEKDEMATKIAEEVRKNIHKIYLKAKNIEIPSINDVYDELTSLDKAKRKIEAFRDPSTTRTIVLAEIYLCFIYLKDRILKKIRNDLTPESTARRFIDYLLGFEIRQLRNAISHGDWRYVFSSEFNGIEYGTQTGIIRMSSLDYEVRIQIAKCFICILYQEMLDHSK